MRPLLIRAAIGTAIGAVLAVVVFLIASAAGDPLEVTAPGQPTMEVAVVQVVLATVVGGVLGLVVALLARRLPRPRASFWAITTVGLLLSFSQPFVAAEQTSTALWLCLMHVAVFAGVVPSIASILPTRKDSPVPASG